MNHSFDSLWINASIAPMHAPNIQNLLQNAAIGIKAGKIAWIGEMSALTQPYEKLANIIHDSQGQWITPCLIDCHTHLVYAGNRANEFVARLQGVSYAEIAKNGGGILSTVRATRQASFDELLQQSAKRLQAMLRQGITVVEIKSGYGLDLENELKMLRVAKRLEEMHSVTIKKTLLAAHALPPEYKDRSNDYINLVCNEIIPAAVKENLVDAVDVFCETIGFNLQQTELVFQTAKKFNLAIKIHAEQLSDQQGAALAAKYQALSADHLEFISETGVKALAQAGTVAILLPGAFYYLQEKQKPPIELFRHYKVPIAIATDCNPGTSPTTSLLLMMNMACVLFKLTPLEALAAVTCNAARALGILASHGSLEVGKVADFVVWEVQDLAELSYNIGENRVSKIVKDGKTTF